MSKLDQDIFFVFGIPLLWFASSCGPTTPKPSSTTSSGTDYDGGSATCADVCANERALGCVEASPTPLGASCEEVCTHTAPILRWDLTCRASVKTCAGIDRCEDDWKDSAKP